MPETRPSRTARRRAAEAHALAVLAAEGRPLSFRDLLDRRGGHEAADMRAGIHALARAGRLRRLEDGRFLWALGEGI